MTKEDQFLINKIRKDLAYKIVGYENVYPSKKQLRDYFNKSVKDKPYYWAYTLHSIATLKSVERIDFSNIIGKRYDNETLEQAFDLLLKNQHDRCIVTEIYKCPKALPNSNCIWISKDTQNEIPEFAIVISDEKIINEDYQVVVLQKKENEQINIIFLLGESLSNVNNRKEITESYIDLAINMFVYLSNNPTGKFIGLDWSQKRINTTVKFAPPTDLKLIQYLDELTKGQRYCIKAKVKIEDIVPFSYAHAYEIPETYIFDALEGIIDLSEVSILTYVKGNKYVMSDDYSVFLALKISDIDKVTIVNLGNLIDESSEVLAKGGIELLPPLMFKQYDFDALPISEQEKKLNDKLYAIKNINRLKKFLLSDFLDIKNEIDNDELGKAIIQLKPFAVTDDSFNILTSISARLSKLRNDKKLGIVKYDDEIIEFNRIRISLLSFIDDLKH